MKLPIANWQLAIGNELAVAEGFEPSMAGLTIRCLTNLATPQYFVSEPGAVATGSRTQPHPRENSLIALPATWATFDPVANISSSDMNWRR